MVGLYPIGSRTAGAFAHPRRRNSRRLASFSRPSAILNPLGPTLAESAHSTDWFFLAMAHHQLGHKDEGRKWYDIAVSWMDKNQPQNDELRRFRAEAAELLGIKEPPPELLARQKSVMSDE